VVQVFLVLKALLALRDLKDPKVLLGLRVLKANRVFRDFRDLRDSMPLPLQLTQPLPKLFKTYCRNLNLMIVQKMFTQICIGEFGILLYNSLNGRLFLSRPFGF
jgi:hypothetical protein